MVVIDTQSKKIILVSPYEIGRQPFGLAHPAACLQAAGFEVRCVDLSLQRITPDMLEDAALVGLYLAMHTATRIAVEAIPKLKQHSNGACFCAFGLYAPMNASLLHELGVTEVIGGEYETRLLEIAERLHTGDDVLTPQSTTSLSGVQFRVPLRDSLPSLDQYASLLLAEGGERTIGFAETTRGCKHLCRHCPVVPVYEGRFKAIPRDIVLTDIDNQVAAGARHISFGDPDFLNGPTHALRIVAEMHRRHPALSFDATIKVEHLLTHSTLLPALKENGCALVITAVEAIDDHVLQLLDKGHTGAQFDQAIRLLRDVGIDVSPTFMPFTPWTTIEGYRALLTKLIELALVESVAPVQLVIRLLVPAGSKLLELDGFEDLMQPFDSSLLGFPWQHQDPAVDALHAKLQGLVETGEAEGLSRPQLFEQIWQATHEALGEVVPALPDFMGHPVARLSETWYCCAEPTSQQLEGI
ncbi:MAG: radical SAM protein [Thiotrichales bacterium]|nr:radical SAM protein [Thiotrichales bacterium]